MTTANLHTLLTNFLTPEGFLRDIVVKDTTRDDWIAVLNKIDTQEIPCNYNGLPLASPLIDCLPDDFANRTTCGTLTIYPQSLCVLTHFFDDKELEFDVNPQDLVSNPANFDLLLSFMQLLGNATRKPCHLTSENRHDEIALTWLPDEHRFIPSPNATPT